MCLGRAETLKRETEELTDGCSTEAKRGTHTQVPASHQ